MGTSTVPILRLELSKDGKTINILDAHGQPHPIKCIVSDVASKRHRTSLKNGLDQLKRGVQVQNRTIEVVGAAFNDLNTRGLSILSEIFEDKLSEVRQIFRKSFPDWDSSPEPLNITVVAELNRFVPLELLPIFDTSMWPPVINDQRDLERSIRRFPGFCAVIKREFTDPDQGVNQDLIFANEPKLPLRCFVNESFEGLPAAEEEFGFFKSHADHIDLDGPWPPISGLTDIQFWEKLANYLLFADEKFDGQPRSPVDQIQHFICDCIVDQDADESVLRLSSRNQIKIYQLQAQITNEQQKENPKIRPESAPLIFLNACGSSRIDPMDITSFPQLFLKVNKYRGFIGTETNVPDRFAAEFSQCFYRELLSGRTLGEAMYKAKWSMLRDKKNPLGIIYTTYADPNMRVSKAVEI